MAGPETTRALSATGRRLLWAMIAGGLAIRVVLAFETYGVSFDIESLAQVEAALSRDPLHLYSIVNGDPYNRWPYLSGYLPFVGLAHGLAAVTGPFHGWIQLPSILADGAIAWLVQSYLGLRGAGERTRLAAAGLVALGPSFAAISGYHGQIDSLAILPAVLAVYWWDTLPAGWRRAAICGGLVGCGIALKTAPGLVLLALLPTARSNRERVVLVAAAVVVPLVAVAPWLIADTQAVVDALRSHRAVPGVGGISLLVQPELARFWLGTGDVGISPANSWLVDHETAIVVLGLAPVAAFVWRRGVPPARAATILWVAFYAFAGAFALQYAVWGLPFALMAGYVRGVAWVQAALLVPTLLIYWHPFDSGSEYVYVPMMIGLWIAVVAVLAGLIARTRPRIAA